MPTNEAAYIERLALERLWEIITEYYKEERDEHYHINAASDTGESEEAR